jgi:hypothetical protein
MSKQSGKSNIADDAARARKLLEKHAPSKVSGLNKGNFTLQQGVNQTLGEHAVIVVIGEQTVHQYTVSRPIGITNADPKLDWVINRTDYLPSMISRKADPAIGAINQERAMYRTQWAVDNKLLIVKEVAGKYVHFYPNREDMTRNELLSAARAALKEEQRRIQDQIKETDDRAKKNAYSNQLAQLTDPTKFLDEVTAESETQLRLYWESDNVCERLEIEVPQTYRTLTGPYADQPQVSVGGATGMSLDAVVNAISAKIAAVTFEPGLKPALPLSGPVSGAYNVKGAGAAEAAPDPHSRKPSLLGSAAAAIAGATTSAISHLKDGTHSTPIKDAGKEETKSDQPPAASTGSSKKNKKNAKG